VDARFAAYGARDPYLLLHKAVYFLLCAGLSTFTPFIAVYLRDVAGYSTQAVGVVMALRPLAILVSTPIWARIADCGYRRSIMIGTAAAATLVRTATIASDNVAYVAFTILAGEALAGSLFSLLDAAILSLLDVTSSTTYYGRTRLWGSIGWGAMAPLGGLIADAYGYRALFLTHAILMAPGIALATRIPVDTRAASRASNSAALASVLTFDVGIFMTTTFTMVRIIVIGDDMASQSLTTTTIPRHPLPIAQGMLGSIIGSFQFLFLQELGAPHSLMGLALTFTILSEVPSFFVSSWVLKRVGVVPVLAASLVAYAVRLGYYSQLQEPYATLPAELLHGLTFALGWAAATKYMHDTVPHDLAATALGLLSAAYNGVGACTGAMVGGALYASRGSHAMFAISCSFTLIGATALAVGAAKKRWFGRSLHASPQAPGPLAAPPPPPDDRPLAPISAPAASTSAATAATSADPVWTSPGAVHGGEHLSS